MYARYDVRAGFSGRISAWVVLIGYNRSRNFSTCAGVPWLYRIGEAIFRCTPATICITPLNQQATRLIMELPRSRDEAEVSDWVAVWALVQLQSDCVCTCSNSVSRGGPIVIRPASAPFRP
jgi:hypothetical protein